MLIGTVIFLSLVVILLAMPVTLTYRLSWRQTLSASLRLNWAFGLVRADVSPAMAKTGVDTPETDAGQAGGLRKSKGRRIDFMVPIRQAPFRRRILRFVMDVWRGIQKRNVQLRVRMGLGDPADTGRLWAVLGPVSGMLARPGDVRIAIEPDFLDATLDVDSSGTIRIIPLQMAILSIGLLLSPSVWRGVMLMRASG